ncbi:hypothetical protein BJ322DRAFT_1032219 [Thelephora terrestris]|uniref:Uncharacterized protein n=1 Tax=Thelephora terrestris TaxID=56493 RepID=A0A9P6HRI4_9AGAM|nr:hypothetical protein BJ322DRAFT_1032219 [Thelephora terrestris]
MTLLLHYWLASSGDLSLLFLTLLTVVNWQHLELGKWNSSLLTVFLSTSPSLPINSVNFKRTQSVFIRAEVDVGQDASYSHFEAIFARCRFTELKG